MLQSDSPQFNRVELNKIPVAQGKSSRVGEVALTRRNFYVPTVISRAFNVNSHVSCIAGRVLIFASYIRLVFIS